MSGLSLIETIRKGLGEKGCNLKALALFCVFWLATGIVNIFAKYLSDRNIDTPILFPFSVLVFKPHLIALFVAPVFLLLLWYAARQAGKMNVAVLWVLCLLFLFLGNLCQGGLSEGFIDPINSKKVLMYYDDYSFDKGLFKSSPFRWVVEATKPTKLRSASQYYHDTERLMKHFDHDVARLLRDYTKVQRGYMWVHTAVHPPGPFLFYYYLPLVGSLGLVSFVTGLCSSFACLLVYAVFRFMEASSEKAALAALLFSVVPSVNIYSFSTIDACILFFMTLSLASMVRLSVDARFDPKVDAAAIVLFIVGVVVSSTLTFLAAFVLAVSLAFSLYLLLFRGNYKVLAAFATAFCVMSGAIYALYAISGYNYIESFFVASSQENLEGFRLFSHPVEYVLTRIEGAMEFMIFLSLPVLGVLFSAKAHAARTEAPYMLGLAGFFMFLAMLGAGAFYTGETGRVMQFLVPYAFLLLLSTGSMALRALLLLAGLQTIIMQGVGWYFW